MAHKPTRRSNKRDSPKMVEAAREIYLGHGGMRHMAIEREMRELGYGFRRQMLHTTQHRTGITVGWPEKYGWNDELTPEQQLRRRRSNNDGNAFELWLSQTSPEWSWHWPYQRYIYKFLHRINTGRSRRLMIFMPPRHGKSEMVTVRYTVWRLLRDASMNAIIASYNQRLADKFSRKIKRLYEAATPPLPNSSAPPLPNSSTPPLPNSSTPPLPHRRLATAAEWETPAGGIVRSVGVGGGIAGFGADLIVIDDPVRSRADAESANNRDRVHEWFNDDIYTRIEPKAAIILIQTRWHEDDLAGRLLKEHHAGGEQWDIVSLPAIAGERIKDEGEGIAQRIKDEGERIKAAQDEDSDTHPTPGPDSSTGQAKLPSSSGPSSFIPYPLSFKDPLGRRPGEALCPARYDVAALERFRRKLGSYSFAALYQQDPHPADGGQFKRSWFKSIIDAPPANLRWVRGYDLAVSLKTTADYTASFRVARDKRGDLYIEGGFRRRIEYPEQRRYIIERMHAERMTQHCVEDAVHGRAIVQDLRRDPAVLRFPLRVVPVRGDKLTRALAWLNLAEEGRVHLVRGPWIEDFLDELARFPTGRHDDQLDAISLAVQSLSGKQGSGRLHTFNPGPMG